MEVVDLTGSAEKGCYAYPFLLQSKLSHITQTTEADDDEFHSTLKKDRE